MNSEALLSACGFQNVAGRVVCGLHAGSSRGTDKAPVSVEGQEPQEYMFSFWLVIFHCGQTILLKALS